MATGKGRPVIVTVGGFLGAGKTTLILAASRVLHARGMRAAAILNDQGAELVDTQFIEENGVPADQVTGGCFCCRFSDLLSAVERLQAHAPHVIFAEAVGSCTDISATMLQPLKRDFGESFDLAPFTVLVDPARARELLSAQVDPDLAFLFRNQVAEADLVCFSKADLYSDFPEISGAPVRVLSPKTGQGVAEWLDEILCGELTAGGKLLDIDYNRYAQAEARLAWFNCRLAARLDSPLSPSMLVGPFLERLCEAITAAGIQIVHLKLIDKCPAGYIKVGVCANHEQPSVEGTLDASPTLRHELLLNVRAGSEPERLRNCIEKEIAELPGEIEIRLLQCFQPSPPKPERRMTAV